MSSDTVVVPVVAACIVQSGTVLLSKRLTAKEPSTLGKWEFPGGRVHFGEKLEDAVKREIREELNLSVAPGRILHAQINTYDSGTEYLVVFFECALIGEVTCCAKHLQWVRPQIVIESAHDVLPGTVEAVLALQEVLRCQKPQS